MALRAPLGKVGFPLRAAALPKDLNQSSRKLTDPSKFEYIGKHPEVSIAINGENCDNWEQLQKHIKLQNRLRRAAAGCCCIYAALLASYLAKNCS